MNPYLSGEKLYGEDLSPEEISKWFADEKEGYYETTKIYESNRYSYHALNVEHGFRHLPQKTFYRVLGIGSATGDEFAPILHQCQNITILDPSEAMSNARFQYARPDKSGLLPFPDQSFDLIACLNVLHHIPKVSVSLKEIGRVLTPDGYALISEPITSMGDWNHPRKGLTQNERGIPLQLFRSMVAMSGLRIYRESLHSFALTSRWRYVIREAPYNTTWVVKLDRFLCRLPWFKSYHATGIKKLRATCVFFVVTSQKYHSK